MKLRVVLSVAATVLGLSCLAASAQSEPQFEVGAGANYALLSEKMYMDQALAFRLRAGLKVAPKWTLLGIYEHATSDSSVPNVEASDVTLQLYGANLVWAIRGERQLELIVVLGGGLGSLKWDNPGAPVPGLRDDTDVLWYEAGAGANIGFASRWAVRLQLTARQYRPADPSAILPSSRLTFVPSADIVFRF